jgi:hypothetical protein
VEFGWRRRQSLQICNESIRWNSTRRRACMKKNRPLPPRTCRRPVQRSDSDGNRRSFGCHGGHSTSV